MKYLKIIILFVAFSSFSQGVDNFKHFTVKHGEKGAEWCSYRLTVEMVEADSSLTRESFKAYKGIKSSHYLNTGFDRGHLAPADAFSFDQEAYSQTFSLANIVPQDPRVNRRVWKGLEVYEKDVARAYGCIDVVIRVEYDSVKVKKLWIPKKLTKEIYTCDKKLLGTYTFFNRLNSSDL